MRLFSRDPQALLEVPGGLAQVATHVAVAFTIVEFDLLLSCDHLLDAEVDRLSGSGS